MDQDRAYKKCPEDIFSEGATLLRQSGYAKARTAAQEGNLPSLLAEASAGTPARRSLPGCARFSLFCFLRNAGLAQPTASLDRSLGHLPDEAFCATRNYDFFNSAALEASFHAMELKKPSNFRLKASSGWKTGLEPATSGTTIQRSNQLSYNHHVIRSKSGCKYNLKSTPVQLLRKDF